MASTKYSTKPMTSTTPVDEVLKDTAAVKFPAFKVDVTQIDRTWEQRRGAMTRIALLVLRDNDSQLADKFCRSNRAALTAMKTAEDLNEEVEFLKKGIEILEAAANRLMIVAARRELSNREKEVNHGR